MRNQNNKLNIVSIVRKMAMNIVSSIRIGNQSNRRALTSISGNSHSDGTCISSNFVCGCFGVGICGTILITFIKYPPKAKPKVFIT